jgi:hypothetical protein
MNDLERIYKIESVLFIFSNWLRFVSWSGNWSHCFGLLVYTMRECFFVWFWWFFLRNVGTCLFCSNETKWAHLADTLDELAYSNVTGWKWCCYLIRVFRAMFPTIGQSGSSVLVLLNDLKVEVGQVVVLMCREWYEPLTRITDMLEMNYPQGIFFIIESIFFIFSNWLRFVSWTDMSTHVQYITGQCFWIVVYTTRDWFVVCDGFSSGKLVLGYSVPMKEQENGRTYLNVTGWRWCCYFIRVFRAMFPHHRAKWIVCAGNAKWFESRGRPSRGKDVNPKGASSTSSN